MSAPVYYNPATPFETLLQNVQPGMTINVHGRRTQAGDRFAIQFKTGAGPHADLAFRFCPRWVSHQPEVIGNSRIGNQWGHQIMFLQGSSPFVMGQSFQVMIMIQTDGFKIAVNGAHFATFPHRVNMHNIKYLEIVKAIAIDQVSIYNQGGSSPAPPATVYNPVIPYETALSSIQPGMSFTVYGRPGGADRFGIQFKSGPGQNADLLFRFCPRWINNTHEVIGNSRIKKQWGHQVTFMAGSSPFVQGQNFQVMIVIEADEFKVAVNGAHFASFPHRINMHSIKYFEVNGGVVVDQLETSYQRLAYPPRYFQPATPATPVIHPILNPANDRPIAIPLKNIRDHTVTINGVAGGSGRFHFDFMDGSNPPEIFLHFNPRFNENAVVRNTRFQNAWGPEERALPGAFPFTPNQPFQVEVAVDRQCFRISLNGGHLCDFQHRRRPLKDITHMNFAGNAKISSVSFR